MSFVEFWMAWSTVDQGAKQGKMGPPSSFAGRCCGRCLAPAVLPRELVASLLLREPGLLHWCMQERKQANGRGMHCLIESILQTQAYIASKILNPLNLKSSHGQAVVASETWIPPLQYCP